MAGPGVFTPHLSGLQRHSRSWLVAPLSLLKARVRLTTHRLTSPVCRDHHWSPSCLHWTPLSNSGPRPPRQLAATSPLPRRWNTLTSGIRTWTSPRGHYSAYHTVPLVGLRTAPLMRPIERALFSQQGEAGVQQPARRSAGTQVALPRVCPLLLLHLVYDTGTLGAEHREALFLRILYLEYSEAGKTRPRNAATSIPERGLSPKGLNSREETAVSVLTHHWDLSLSPCSQRHHREHHLLAGNTTALLEHAWVLTPETFAKQGVSCQEGEYRSILLPPEVKSPVERPGWQASKDLRA